jgi:hypothetical protein
MNEIALGESLKRGTLGEKPGGLFASRMGIYICILLIAALASYAVWMREYSIFACMANGYTADRYLGQCGTKGYGDYEHGAFWLGLEPAAQNFAKDADVLFFGNSRIQFAFSTKATADWFSAASIRYYLLGFTYNEGASFAEALLHRIRPNPKVYVINVDNFFDQEESLPAREVTHDPGARSHYEAKRRWQRVHEQICKAVPAICGHTFAIFRSRENGAFSLWPRNWSPEVKPVSYDQGVSEDVVTKNADGAITFFSYLPVKENCVILTIVPTVETKIGNANAISAALHKDLVTPRIPGLQVFDGSHLDPTSAERWSQAFFQMAGAKIRSCLQKQDAAHS